MRLKNLKIKNFRSIKETQISFLDLGISTFIGANGSGKSNILKALVAFMGDENVPTNDDFHAIDEDDGDAIEIEIEIGFESGDAEILQENDLDSFRMVGFTAKVTKLYGQSSYIEFEHSVPQSKILLVTSKRLNDLMNVTEELEEDPSFPETKNVLQALVREALDETRGLLNERVEEFELGFGKLEFSIPDQREKIAAKIAHIKDGIRGNLDVPLGSVLSKLTVELLELNSYTIENSATIEGLSVRDKHPFLYDLLQLSGKSANEFERMGSPALSRTKDTASRRLSDSLSRVWPSHTLKFQIDRHGDSLVFMVFTPQNRQVSLTDLSDGEQWFLKFYVRLAIAQNGGQQVLWLFDEPGRDLHTTSQVDLKRFFETIAVSSQILYTSHLAMMIPWHRLERIFAVENSASDGTVVHTRFWKDADQNSPLKQALSTFVGEELIGGKEHLIVEGISDVFYLQAWIVWFQKKPKVPTWAQSYGLLNRVLSPVDGIEKIPLYCWFLGRKVKKGINWAVIVDSAAEAAATNKKMTDAGLGAWTKNVKSVGELISKKATGEEIEAVFKPSEYIEMFHQYYREQYPNCIIPSRAEIIERLEKQSKLTKAVGELLIEKNPKAITLDGVSIALDKTGIAQYIYKQLTQNGADVFSKDTEVKFGRLLENIDKLFQVEQE